MEHDSTIGYTSLNEEIALDQLPIQGSIPVWLSGSLVRNGPAKFEVGTESFQHWFDGFAMLHRFTFERGRVSYANKFLQSDSYRQSMEQGRIVGASFGTDPCKAVFKPSMTEVVNANVSINHVAGEYVAMTETPLPVVFDPRTLETLGVMEFGDRLTGHHGSAHPHHDASNRRTISYMTEFGMESQFKVFAIKEGRPERTLIGSYPVMLPSYIHSFSISEQYVIIAEYPYRVNPMELLMRNRPFIENFKWYPEQGTQLLVMDKRNGSIVGRFSTDAFFSFHHINAFEQDGDVFVDLSAYPDASIVTDLYLEQLRNNRGRVDGTNESEFRRYHLPLGHPADPVTYEMLSWQGIELPTINYRRSNAREYGVAYGISVDKQRPEAVSNQLVRVDVDTRTTTIWSEQDCYPGEPILVEAPDARAEDDGVVLSVVLNARKGNSFLLVLDAHTFAEIGRAEVPHHVPFGFHGWFFPT
ncbi:15,15' beta carotene dioxygenase [Dictyobacter sp. S3.2.2.5]|uniref:15,15' beta carotene dioxygenase n=1 Tax=Dictyobacter halimunensis TaxID=3026934 RepID=A0ABQ6FPE7_9CHLR|nr:15,15' beta carotene dioxygenase [Dictyobacter sp. S3.2.2.5]